MVRIMTHTSSFNSFSSICYCLLTLGVHAYSCYSAILRYKESESRAWPGGGGTPSEAAMLLGFTILSIMLMPMLCMTAFIKVGNLANDGVKLGRDHALGASTDTSTKDCSGKHVGVARVWKHFCPISQTLHVVAAFLLLVPETFLTAVEIKFGYKTSVAAWSSNIDFLYSPERAFLSEIRSSINISLYSNTTHVVLPTAKVPTEASAHRLSVSIAFVNFCFALTCFLVRYASVFWYTNKPLTAVFAFQLLAMVINSLFSFNCFSTLYSVCYNRNVFPNVQLSLNCMADVVLYLFGSTILLLSTMAVFEYGSHYFHEKFKIVERHHNPESYIKQTTISHSGCQGYISHLCAIATLVIFAVCKGPLLYEQMSLMRLTGDQLLLSGVVCEVCYMVLWVALWFGLTIKQQWKFRILDYVPLRQPLNLITDESSVKSSQLGQGDASHTDSLTRGRRHVGREARYLDPGAVNNTGDEPYHSDIGTDESDVANNAEVVLDLDGNPISDGVRRSRQRRNCGQRVTFDDSVRRKGSGVGGNNTPTSSLTRHGAPKREDVNHVNITADIHVSLPISSNVNEDVNVTLRSKTTDSVQAPREYRNSIRNKCGEYYSSINNLSSNFEEPVMGSSPTDGVPTLMSSFRDKVRESSLAASSFRERERHMLEQFEFLDPPPPVVNDIISIDVEKRRCPDVAAADGESYRGDNNALNFSNEQEKFRSQDSSRRPEVYFRYDSNMSDANLPYESTKSTSLTRQSQHNASLSSDDDRRSSLGNSTAESSELSLPPLMEEIQVSRVRTGSNNVTGMAKFSKDNFHHMNGSAVLHRPK
ncbi:uncharacterized protein LOC106065014 isoform X2 [Biomphalaria glabrata]|uniref:Uncharacterized protein LOC106065014 isoform X2 n=1 Tax=Biomphalaria glabrata TaxID=6526 RepID=A0A9U8EA87_BIOGL|nr:uncharacterized protein LOC106065014 isoform X2 [Biomphalaria glabrata]